MKEKCDPTQARAKVVSQGNGAVTMSVFCHNEARTGLRTSRIKLCACAGMLTLT